MGVLRDVSRPTYDGLMADQVEQPAPTRIDDGALADLLRGKDSWQVVLIGADP